MALTWNGAAQTPVLFQTTGHSPGDDYLLSVQVQALLQKYESLKGIIAIIGENELSPADRADYAKAKLLIKNFTQNMNVMTKHNGIPGDFFSREDTLKSIEEIVV